MTSRPAGSHPNPTCALVVHHTVDANAGATASFESRGSNLHPAGAIVTVPTITGHRRVSQIACPGDGADGCGTGR